MEDIISSTLLSTVKNTHTCSESYILHNTSLNRWKTRMRENRYHQTFHRPFWSSPCIHRLNDMYAFDMYVLRIEYINCPDGLVDFSLSAVVVGYEYEFEYMHQYTNVLKFWQYTSRRADLYGVVKWCVILKFVSPLLLTVHNMALYIYMYMAMSFDVKKQGHIIPLIR